MIRTFWPACFGAVLLVGMLGCQNKNDKDSMNMSGSSTTTSRGTPVAPTYACAMHPGVAQSEPGKCPICGMNLLMKK